MIFAQGVSQPHIKSLLLSYLGICHLLPRRALLQFAEMRHIRRLGIIFHALFSPLPEIRSGSKPYQQSSLKFSLRSFSAPILVQFHIRGIM